MIRFALVLFFILVVFVFTIKNLDKTIRIQSFFGYESPPLPVYLLVIGAFFFGMLMAVVLLLPEWVKNRMQLRRHEKTLQRLELEFDKNRSSSKKEKNSHQRMDKEDEAL